MLRGRFMVNNVIPNEAGMTSVFLAPIPRGDGTGPLVTLYVPDSAGFATGQEYDVNIDLVPIDPVRIRSLPAERERESATP
jgi:hypothetical protein